MTRHLLTCLVLVLCVTGCEHEKPHLESAVFLVTNPATESKEISTRFVAQIRSIQHIELRPMEHGYLESVHVDEGQQVKKGQRLFQILPTVLQAELKKAQAEAELAEIEFQNTKVLADRKVVSPNELAMSHAKLDKANAELALAKVHRDFTEIKAPFDGIIGRFNARLGSLVSETDLLSTLSDNSKMWVYFNVTEGEYLAYRARVAGGEAPTVSLLLANGQPFDQVGKIEAIEADFNNETGTIAFRATFSNPAGMLRHGQTGTVVMKKTLENALVIPQKATFEVLDKRYVYVVDANHVAKARQISVAEELPHLFLIESGLAATDQIVLEGVSKIRDGDTLHVKRVEPTEALAHLDVPAE